MTNAEIARKNAEDMTAIKKAGFSYTVRKYAGAWVPVVIANGKRHTFAHCSTSGGAMEIAISRAAEMAREA